MLRPTAITDRVDRIRTCDLVLMPKRSNTEDWINAINAIKTSLAFLQTVVISRKNKAKMRELFRSIEKLE